MLILQAVTYYKRSGEFLVKYRDAVSGKPVIYRANRLKESELIFCKTSPHRHEGPDALHWS